MRYRKKPVVIDAIQWTGINVEAVMSWAGEMALKYKRPQVPGKITVDEINRINFDMTHKPHIMLTIYTPDATTIAPHGWYIACAENGMFFCLPADTINRDYDKVHPEYIEPDGPAVVFQRCKGCGHFLDECDCGVS